MYRDGGGGVAITAVATQPPAAHSNALPPSQQQASNAPPPAGLVTQVFVTNYEISRVRNDHEVDQNLTTDLHFAVFPSKFPTKQPWQLGVFIAITTIIFKSARF